MLRRHQLGAREEVADIAAAEPEAAEAAWTAVGIMPARAGLEETPVLSRPAAVGPGVQRVLAVPGRSVQHIRKAVLVRAAEGLAVMYRQVQAMAARGALLEAEAEAQGLASQMLEMEGPEAGARSNSGPYREGL